MNTMVFHMERSATELYKAEKREEAISVCGGVISSGCCLCYLKKGQNEVREQAV